MDIQTLTRDYRKQDEIDFYESAIWTDRYYGDGDFELQFDAKPEYIQKVLPGQLLICDAETDKGAQVKICEELDIESDVCTAKGITVLKWLNNRFIRYSPDNKKTEVISGVDLPSGVGLLMFELVKDMATPSLWVHDYAVAPGDAWPTNSMGILNASKFAIPKLWCKGFAGAYPTGVTVPDIYGEPISYGPLFDALFAIATKYQVGQMIEWSEVAQAPIPHPPGPPPPPSPPFGPGLAYSSYVGEDRRGRDFGRGPLSFAPDMENLIDVKELHSISDVQTIMWGWGTQIAPVVGMDTTFKGVDPPTTKPDWATDPAQNGFDLKARVLLDGTMSDDQIGIGVDGSHPFDDYVNILKRQISDQDFAHLPIKLVEGQIANANYKYGVDFFLGDIVSLEGFLGVSTDSIVTEYVRSQDNAGSKAYPTVSALQPIPT